MNCPVIQIQNQAVSRRCPKGGGGGNGRRVIMRLPLPKERVMYDKNKLDELSDSVKKWEETSLQKALSSLPERTDEFITTSSEPINRLYTPRDVADNDYTDRKSVV